MESVFLVKYRPIDTGEKKSEELKVLGVFSTRERCKMAMEYLGMISRSKDLTDGHIYFDKHNLDEIRWNGELLAIIDYDEYRENFANADEFIDCFNRGCEFQFLYDGKHYCIDPFASDNNDKISVMEAYNEESERFFDTPQEALSYPIGNKCLGDILQDMKVIDRTL